MRRGLAAAVVISLLGAAAAWADETITARPVDRFSADNYTIDQGEKVTLRNLDLSGHDATAADKGPSGDPLFASDLIQPGASGPVRGTEYLVEGHYPFICTVHPGMEATLHVTSAGAPLERPEPPNVSVKILSKDLKRVVKKGKLKLRVEASKASVRVAARAKLGKRRLKLGSRSVTFEEEGSRKVALKLSKKARKKLGKRGSAKVTAKATATDDAAQTAESTATRKLT